MPIVENSITECVRIRDLQERRRRSFQNVASGRVLPGDSPEKRFLEFRLPSEHPGQRLRHLLENEHYVFAPGLYNSGGMKNAAQAGFEAAYLSGYSYGLEEHGSTGAGAFSPVDIAEQARRMVRAGDFWLRDQYVEHGRVAGRIPLVMDLEDGHGSPVQSFLHQVLPIGVAAGHVDDRAEQSGGLEQGAKQVSTERQIERLLAARSEADQMGVEEFVLIARTDAARDMPGSEGKSGGMELAVERSLAYARAEINNRRAIDMAWCDFTGQPWEAIVYWARKVRAEHPDLPLAIDLSVFFDWNDPSFRPEVAMEQLADEGFKYQFMSLAGVHAGRNASWKFLTELRRRGTAAFADLAGMSEAIQ